MHDDRVLTEQRLGRVLRERIRPAVHGAAASQEAVPPGGRRLARARRAGVPGRGAGGAVPALRGGYRLGSAVGTTWFSCRGQVPAEWAGRDVVIDLGFSGGWPGFSAEGLIYLPNGSPVRGLHPYQRSVRLDQLAPSAGLVEFFVEAAANPDHLGTRHPAGGHAHRRGRAGTAAAARGELAVDWEGIDGTRVFTHFPLPA